MKQYLLLTLSFFLLSVTAHATHNRAGEILIKQIGPLTVEATIITYTKSEGTTAITVEWGDGTKSEVPRTNGSKVNGNFKGEDLPNAIRKNIYKATHTYPGLKPFYTVSISDPNRNAGIKNIGDGQSDTVPFYIKTSFTLLSQQFEGKNSTPILLQPPIDFGCVGEIFTHNPNAYDEDGDSLAYSLVKPFQSVGVPVPKYKLPNQISPGLNNNINLNAFTGTFTWNAPQLEGEYNIAIMIVSYRDGFAIDTIVRDMQIRIQKNCDNKPPVLTFKDEICVVAGTLIDLPIVASDPDVPKQKITLSALGGPLQISNNGATFTAPKGYSNQLVNGRFKWQTNCSHISSQYYTVVFKAQDNFKIDALAKDTTGLVTLKTLRIKIVGPKPLDLTAKSFTNQIDLSWQNPYTCDNAPDNYFYGFSVWRREGSNPFKPDTCTTGLVGQGYTRIGVKQKTIVAGRYYFKDTKVERGKTYCYRILAEFAKLTAAGNPYNEAESIASDETCVQLNRDVPLMTNVSVEKTNVTNGEIFVQWSKPKAKDLDTLLNTPPYRYELFRVNGATSTLITGASFTSATFAAANDTSFTEKNLNTATNQYAYKVAFYVKNEAAPLGFSPSANSPFLKILGTDQANILTWDTKVSWQNYRTIIYRKNNTTNVFDSINTSLSNTYKDNGLDNGKEYCYYIKTIGTYGISNILNPLYNKSQETCGTPKDDTPPCPIAVRLDSICKTATSDTPLSDFLNTLTWNNPNRKCELKDAIGYNIYYKAPLEKEFKKIKYINNLQDTTFQHKPDAAFGIAGCYTVTAIDSVGNESKKETVVCRDNCIFYELPNTFTPNGDGQNDLYRPMNNYRFVSKIEMTIQNRWGQTVFETQDPAINWDGNNQQGQALAEGTYYYKCRIFENRLEGQTEQKEVRSGYIHLFRSK
jgi:gliding motility-associated-like protein